MSLTNGTAPFGKTPGGVFNRDMPPYKGLIWWEDSPRRIRGRFAGETVVDSRHPKMLHEHGLLPVYYFPRDEVRTDLLEQSDKRTHCPWKGEATHWTLRVGDRSHPAAAWEYEDPLDDAPPLAGCIAFYWDALDEWLEEDEELVVHARDPYHRVDVLDSSRHVRVSLEGETLAESTRTRVIYETGLPPRWYFPREDVRMDLLEASDRRTGCAYKGFASYWSARVDDELAENLVWTYEEPRRDAARVKGMLAFFNEHVDLEVDGESMERPETQWSRRGSFARPSA